MNRMFRVIWSTALGAWVVASESTTRCGKGGRDNGRCQAVVAGVGAAAVAVCCWSSPALAQTYTWLGPNSGAFHNGNYFDTTAWSISGSAPISAGTTAVINPGVTVTIQLAGQTVAPDAIIVSSSHIVSLSGGGTYNFATAAGFTHNGSGNVGVGSKLGGIGAVTQNGTGSLFLNTANSYTGGTNISNGTLSLQLVSTLGATSNTTTISGGTLNLGSSTQTQAALNQSGGTVQTGTMNVATYQLTGGTLAAGTTVNTSTSLNVQAGTVNGVLGGAGALSKSGAGTATLSGANTYTGGTTVSNGVLQLSGPGTLGATANTTTVAGGSLNLGSSTQTQAALNQSGGTVQTGTMNVATYQLTGGTLAADATVNAATAFAMQSGTVSGVLGGTGALNKSGAGTVILSGANTYTGGTTIAAGTLQLGNGGTSGGIVGDVVNNGALALDRSDTVTLAGTISGNGILQQIGTGTEILAADNTYIGGTTISAGTLQLGSGGTSGGIVGDVVNNGTLVIDRSDTVTLPGAISGSGVLQQIGPGTTILTGNNTYTGGTTIAAGALQLGNGGTSGNIVGGIVNNASLAVDRSDTATLTGTISGSGELQQVGTGTTILTANNAYTGGTNVVAGALAIGDASHSQATSGSGNVSVASGAALGGYGQIAGSVQSDGTLAPANALPVFAAGATGTLRIGGSLTSNGKLLLAAANGTAGNVLQVAGNYAGNGQLVLNTVFNQGGSASQTDRLIVGGNTSGSTAIAINRSGSGAQTVGDGIQVVQVGGTSAAKSFRLAGPVQAGAYQYLLYQGGATDSNSWYLRSQLEQTTSSAGAGGAATSTAPGAAASVAAAVAYRPAVIGYSVTPLLNADYGFAVLGRQQARVGDEASADAAQPAHRNGIWGRIGGQNLDADAGNRFSADEHAFFAQFGKDWALAHDGNGASTHVGATVTFGSTSASFSDNLRGIGGLSTGTGTVETQAQSLGGYWTRYLPDGSYFDGVGQLTHYHNRYGDVFGGGASQNGFGAGVSGEVGKPFALGATGVAVEPQAQLLYQYLHLNGFDDGISQVGSTSTNGLRGRLGFRLFKANLSNDSKTSSVTPWFAADVLHDFLSPGQTTVGSTALNDQLGKTWYELGLGVTGTFGKRSTLFADVRYAHSAGGDYRRTVSGQAGYRFSW